MDDMVRTLYMCYLGPTLAYRTVSVVMAISDYRRVFEKYGTSIDSISNFISRGEKIDSKIFLKRSLKNDKRRNPAFGRYSE